MATLIFTGIASTLTGAGAAAAAGTALTGAQIFWGTLATVAGAYVDQTLILPEIFNKPSEASSQGPEVQSIDEGSPHRFSIGPEARVPGFLAWQPRELTFVPGEEPGKGGGAGKGQGSVDKYYTDGVWLFTRRPIEEGGISNINKLWLDAKLRYDDDAEQQRVDSALYEITERVTLGGTTKYAGAPERLVDSLEYTVVGLSTSAPSFNDFLSTRRVKVYDAADSRLNTPESGSGSSGWEVTLVGVTSTGLPTLRFVIPGSYFRQETSTTGFGGRPLFESDLTAGEWVGDLNPAGSPITFIQSQDKFDSGLFSSLSIRAGDRAHAAFSFLETAEGPGPKWYNFSALGIENLLLADFGTRLPNVEALIEADETPVPLDFAISRILEYYIGLDSSQFNVDAVGATEQVRGYWWESAASGFDILGPLLLAYDIIIYEIGGVAYFALRSNLDVVTVPEEELGTTQGVAPADAPTLLIKEETIYNQTKSVNIRYTDPDSTYQIGDMVFTRPDIEGGSATTLDLTRLTLTSVQARNIANRVLWQSASFSREIEFVLPPKYYSMSAGTIVETTSFGRSWRIVVTDVARGNDGRFICSGYEDVGTTEDLPSIETDQSGGAGAAGGFYIPPTMSFLNAQIPAVPGFQATSPATAFVYAAANPFADYRGADLYRGDDETGQYNLVTSAGQESTLGSLVTAMPLGAPHVVNEVLANGAIQIRLSSGELESISEAQLLLRNNIMFCEGEVFSFETAVITEAAADDGGTFDVYGQMLRGLYGTESKIAAHPAGSQVFLFEQNLFTELQVLSPDIGAEFDYRCPSSGQDVLEGTLNSTPELLPENVRPYTPGHLRGVRGGQGTNLPNWSSAAGTVYALGALVQNNGLAYECILAHDANFVGATGEPGVGATYTTYWLDTTANDVVIDWHRRSREDILVLPATQPPVLEPSEMYELVIYVGTSNTVARTVTPIFGTEHVYTQQAQQTDGNFNVPFKAEVRQLGQYLNSEWNTQTLPNA